MATNKKKEQFTVPGTLVKCESGMWLAFYEHRTDIIANGENEKDALKNLKKLYAAVKKSEAKEDEEKIAAVLPPHTKTKSFIEKVNLI